MYQRYIANPDGTFRKTVIDEPPRAHPASAARAGLRAASAEAGACLPAGESEAAGAGLSAKAAFRCAGCCRRRWTSAICCSR